MSMVDFAIITAKREEFEAVLKRFPAHVEPELEKSLGELRRPYTFRKATTSGGVNYVLAIARGVFQGLSEAQNLTTDLIEDLRPRWILFVGIGGGVPSEDVFLGDVVLATHIHDFSLGADTPMGREQPCRDIIHQRMLVPRSPHYLEGKTNLMSGTKISPVPYVGH